MTSLAARKPTKAEKLAHLKSVARDLAPYLYRAEVAILGMANTAAPFASLADHRQEVYRQRAMVDTLNGMGWVSGKARDKAVTAAFLEVEGDNGGEFSPQAERTLKVCASDAVGRVENFLIEAWLELEGAR